MASAKFTVFQPVPVPSGPPEYEAQRASILAEFAAKVLRELFLPQAVFDSAPRNVTAIPRECGLLTAEELAITENYDAVTLAEAMRTRKLTAVAVATAFAKRAIIAHQLTSCLSEWFMDEAVARAQELDAHLARTGITVGPLHGVPVSLKEIIPLAGHTSSTGLLVTRHVDDADSQLVAILRAAGAVFYCKTAQPQAVMSYESASPAGRVLNPHHTGLSAGGSSGGEAALVALRGSVLGIGSDIGGSVRGPAALSGVYGFKSTSAALFPIHDFVKGGFAATMTVPAAAGPIASSLRGIDLFTSVVHAARPYLQDPSLAPLPWSGLAGTGSAKKPLKVGFMTHDGAIVPQPPVLRALAWARAQLDAAAPGQFETKDFAPYGSAQVMASQRAAYWPDGGRGLKAALAAAGEPMFPLTEWIIRDGAAATEVTGEMSATGVLALRVARDAFRVAFAAHWTAQDVDVVVCPAFVGPAPVHETGLYWNYAAFWNYLDYPGVAVPTPVTVLAKGGEGFAAEHAVPLSDECRHVRQLWGEGDFEGAPVGLQIVARRHHDNELFGALHVMKEALGLK
ncbi:amidase signature domain-containing protein [Lasiosphaeria miniovina]|uniref:amidase n=1 Tax=Lasiosphaeria miniovina TaxID=1954250 RepID=A0AA40ACI8_9PEZI|nr:amidase signature domain-containing protein [Lasiosphaeria miniovina]KAK0713245.1 amidase signature domain-containing protein [Lasiosphaeria miniovina]